MSFNDVVDINEMKEKQEETCGTCGYEKWKHKVHKNRKDDCKKFVPKMKYKTYTDPQLEAKIHSQKTNSEDMVRKYPVKDNHAYKESESSSGTQNQEKD